MKNDNTDNFALFGGAAYYPAGGWYDFRESFPTVEETKSKIDKRWDFWHIINLQTLECVDFYGDAWPPDKILKGKS